MDLEGFSGVECGVGLVLGLGCGRMVDAVDEEGGAEGGRRVREGVWDRGWRRAGEEMKDEDEDELLAWRWEVDGRMDCEWVRGMKGEEVGGRLGWR